jgi:hypothetical protein
MLVRSIAGLEGLDRFSVPVRLPLTTKVVPGVVLVGPVLMVKV